ncbi:hypothetical protein GGF31_005203 [Allomyces arbusculus]|nr:hypothetical protein GGF31_005203 [Allomyces arbusculus]
MSSFLPPTPPGASPATPPPRPVVDYRLPSPLPRALVVCDFDYSLIDADSDEWAITLGGTRPDAEAAMTRMAQRHRDGENWVHLVSEEIAGLFESYALADMTALRDLLATIPMHRSTVALLHTLHARNVDVIVVSDANTFFIESILKSYGVRHCVRDIITNQARIVRSVSGRDLLEIAPLQAKPSAPMNGSKKLVAANCPRQRCNWNLCKSAQLAEYLSSRTQYDRVFYVGDGYNDLCPLALGLVDCAFVRAERRLHRELVAVESVENLVAELAVGMPVRQCRSNRAENADAIEGGCDQESWYMAQSRVPCAAVLWSTGDELQERVVRELERA